MTIQHGAAPQERDHRAVSLHSRLADVEPEMLQHPAEARKVLLELVEEARATGQHEQEAYALCLLGGCAFFQGNYADTLLFSQYCSAICEKYGLIQLHARSLNAVGLASNRLGRYDDALEAYLQSLRLAQQCGDDTGRSRVLINLASVYSDLGHHERALELYQQGQVFAEEGDLLAYRADAMRGIVEELKSLGRYDEAFEHLAPAIAAARDANFRGVLTKLKALEAELYLEFWQLPKAMTAAQRGLEIAQEMTDYEGMARMRCLVGECHMKLAEYDQAISFLTKGGKLAEAIGLQEVASGSKRSLSRIMEIQGDLQQALTYLKQHLDDQEAIYANNARHSTQALEGALAGHIRAEVQQRSGGSAGG